MLLFVLHTTFDISKLQFYLVLSVICVLVLEAALSNKRYKPFTPSDASHRVRLKFPYDAAYALANYGCFCTAQLGFFLPQPNCVYGSVQKFKSCNFL